VYIYKYKIPARCNQHSGPVELLSFGPTENKRALWLANGTLAAATRDISAFQQHIVHTLTSEVQNVNPREQFSTGEKRQNLTWFHLEGENRDQFTR